MKNLLFREAKIYLRDSQKLGGLYPYQKANELNRNIKGLADGENYMEIIRKRIT